MFRNKQKRAGFLIIGSFFLANLFLLLLIESLQANATSPANLSGSQKLVDQPTAHLGDTLQYSLVISNSSATSITASFIDPLPTGLTVEPGSLTATMAVTLAEGTQAITWSGVLAGYEVVTVSFAAAISSGLSVGDSVVNTAVLTGTGQAISLTAITELINFQFYLPFVMRGLTTPALQPIQLTCGSDSWMVNWNNADSGVMYELEEAHTATFTNSIGYNTISTSLLISNPPSVDNFYYYRVRGTVGSQTSLWSNSVGVVGNYLDDFADPNSGWGVSDSTTGRFGYSSDGYEIESKQAGFLLSSLSPDVNRDGYVVEGDVRWQTGSATDGIYGLIFGANNESSQFYFLAIYADLQEYWLFFFDSTLPRAQRLRPIFPSQLPSSAINPGHANNHLQVTRIGDNIEAVVNGIALGSWTDNAQTGDTRAGLIVTANPNHPQSVALFDNFALSDCDGVTAVSTSTGLYQTAVSAQAPAIAPETLFNKEIGD